MKCIKCGVELDSDLDSKICPPCDMEIKGMQIFKSMELDKILDLYIEDAIKRQHLPNGFKISDDARTFIKNVIPKLVEDYNDVHVVNYSIMCFFTGYALGNSNK
jgi:hypothetical protein